MKEENFVPASIPCALDRETVQRILGVKRSRLWAGIKSGEFPAPLKLGSLSRWDSAEIAECQRRRMADARAARDAAPAANGGDYA